MNTDPPVGSRHRAHMFPGRQKRISIRVADHENAEIAAAARQIGLTPTGFCAHAALDAARSLHSGAVARMERETLSNTQAELFQARVALNQLRAELEHTRNDNRATTDDLNKVIARTAQAVADLDEAVSRIHRRLDTSRSTESAG